MKVVERWILEEDDAWWNLDAAHDDVHGRSATRAVCVPVRKLSRNVLVPAQRVELVLLVVVQRGLIPQSPPCGVGIVVDLEIERVVVHLDGVGTSHRRALVVTASVSASPNPAPVVSGWRFAT